MKKNQGANHLGRNPFGKGKKADHEIKEVKAEKIENPPSVERLSPRVADWLLVDLPAESFIWGLKSMLLARDIFQKRSKT